MLQQFADIEIVGEAANGKAALEQIARHKPDVIFLDIEMPELNGLETAAAIGLGGPAIVFVTAYDEYALAAFDAHAIDYLVKPVVKDRLEATVHKLRRRSVVVSGNTLDDVLKQLGKGHGRRFAVKSGQHFRVFDANLVSAVIAKDHYSEIIYGQERTLADDSLDTLESRLDSERFLRIHRSSLINLDYLKELKREGDRKFTAILSDYFATELAVSRDNIDKLKARIAL